MLGSAGNLSNPPKNKFFYQILYSTRDSLMTEQCNLSQSDQDLLNKFIQTENDRTIMSQVKCESCILDQCKHCRLVQNPLNSNLSSEFHTLWKNTHLVKNGQNFAVRVSYIYKTNPLITFHPRNSNYLKIKDKTLRLVKRLLKENKYDIINNEIQKKFKLTHMYVSLI